MAPAIISKRGFLSLVLKGRNGYRVIIRIETGHSNLVSGFGSRIRALAWYFASVKYLSQRPHPRDKTWHKIWMTGLNPTSQELIGRMHCLRQLLHADCSGELVQNVLVSDSLMEFDYVSLGQLVHQHPCDFVYACLYLCTELWPGYQHRHRYFRYHMFRQEVQFQQSLGCHCQV